eukprot:3154015-Prymnesium_polylepis.1
MVGDSPVTETERASARERTHSQAGSTAADGRLAERLNGARRGCTRSDRRRPCRTAHCSLGCARPAMALNTRHSVSHYNV